MARTDEPERLLRALAVLGPHLPGLPARGEIPRELSLAAAQALWTVAVAGPRLGVGAIAARLEISLPRASRLLGDLETRGLVERERDTDDRRRVTVSLSADGRRLANAWRSAQLARLRGLLGVLGTRDTEHLVRIFERAAARLNERPARRAAPSSLARPSSREAGLR